MELGKKLLFIYNPRSGTGSYTAKLSQILQIFSEGGYRVEAFPTEKRGDALERAALADEDTALVVAAGGDGTLNETVSGLIRSGNRFPVGYIPVGSTNDFAASLGLPRTPVKAAERIMNGTEQRIDLGWLGGRPFIYVAAFGAFTSVAYGTAQSLKNMFGHAAYILNGIKSLSEIHAYRAQIVSDGVTYQGDYILGMITNSISVGGFKGITGKNVKLSDGLFEVTLVHAPSELLQLEEITSALTEGRTMTPLVETFKASELIFSCENALPWTVDGEYGGRLQETRIVNEKQTLRMIL